MKTNGKPTINNKEGLFDIHHPHDSLFKQAFRHKGTVTDLLKNRLKPEVLASLDLNTLQLENSSFISTKLKKTYSDLVFSVHSQKAKSYIYILIEHQTQEDKHMMLRLLEYNLALMRQHVANRASSKLPVIINFVLYSGKKPYTGPKSLLEAFEDPVLFTALLQRKLVIALNQESDESLLKDQKAALAEFALAYSTYRDFCKLLDKKPFLIKLVLKSEYADGVILYMLNHEKHKAQKLLQKLDNLSVEKQENIMNALSRIKQEGIRLGKQEGIKLGEQRGEQRGKQEGIKLGKQEGIKLGEHNTLLKLVKKGLISKEVADQLLKEDK